MRRVWRYSRRGSVTTTSRDIPLSACHPSKPLEHRASSPSNFHPGFPVPAPLLLQLLGRPRAVHLFLSSTVPLFFKTSTFVIILLLLCYSPASLICITQNYTDDSSIPVSGYPATAAPAHEILHINLVLAYRSSESIESHFHPNLSTPSPYVPQPPRCVAPHTT